MEKSQWVSSSEASKFFEVSEKQLNSWREIGYLKAGTHWRSAPESKLSKSEQSLPWQPEVIYHLRWCKEEIDYWREHDARLIDTAA